MDLPTQDSVSKRERELRALVKTREKDVQQLEAAHRRKAAAAEEARMAVERLIEEEGSAVIAEGLGTGTEREIHLVRERLASARARATELDGSAAVLSARLSDVRRELDAAEQEIAGLVNPREQARIEAEIQRHAADAIAHLEGLQAALLALWTANQEGVGAGLPSINGQFLADAPSIVTNARVGQYSYGGTLPENREVRR